MLAPAPPRPEKSPNVRVAVRLVLALKLLPALAPALAPPLSWALALASAPAWIRALAQGPMSASSQLQGPAAFSEPSAPSHPVPVVYMMIFALFTAGSEAEFFVRNPTQGPSVQKFLC